MSEELHMARAVEIMNRMRPTLQHYIIGLIGA